MNKISWGILSTSNFAQNVIIPSVKNCVNTEFIGIASRNLTSAKKAAEKHGISKSYGSYEELLADESVDAVYIPLPNHMHAEWIKKSLASGKHVLCEKPIGLNADEAEDVREFAKGYPRQKLMEAFMYRMHPRWIKIKELISQNIIGEVKHIQSFFSYYNVKSDNIRNNSEIGGGGLLDIGCYCISSSRFILDKEPLNVQGKIELDPKFKTDRLTSGILDFDGVTAAFTCSTQIPFDQSTKMYGSKGRIEVHRPFNPELDEESSVLVITEDNTEEIIIDACNHYTIQFDEFSNAILNDAPVPTSFDDAVANMKVIDAVFKSSQTGESVSI